MRVGEALTQARRQIPASEARLLLGDLLQQSAAWLMAHDELVLDATTAHRFLDWVARRAAGEPVAYLLGHREFYGRDFIVAPGVLIPRPETELLVDEACVEVGVGETATILDLGTGSGCVALSIALERPTVEVTALDVSPAAVAIARRNAAHLNAPGRILESNWFAAVTGERFDLIVSNPPYIRADDPHLRLGDLRHEPYTALASDDDGLHALTHIIGAAPDYLRPRGRLWVEHGYDQAEAVRALLRSAGFDDVVSRRDLAGIERISGGRLPS